jgi:hypothetical protein
MYELINRNLDELLGTVEQAADIEPYVWMIRELPHRDVTNDEEFQKKYCSYWALNGAGLGQNFRSEYFSLLEREKCSAGNADVQQITRILYETPVNSKEKKPCSSLSPVSSFTWSIRTCRFTTGWWRRFTFSRDRTRGSLRKNLKICLHLTGSSSRSTIGSCEKDFSLTPCTRSVGTFAYPRFTRITKSSTP